MRQYIYSPEEIGRTEWPSGTLRLEGIEVTKDPANADVFVCPGNIRIFEGVEGSGVLDMGKLYRLPYLKGNESRTAFFDCSDNFKQALNLPIIFIRCDVRAWMRPHDPNTIQVAWPVDNLLEVVALPESGFKFDISCHAWASTEARSQASRSCTENGELKCDIAMYRDFTGYLHDRTTNEWTPEGKRRRSEFRRSMRESRIALCGESIPGVLPYRFFEAMSAARVPLLVGTAYELPFADLIPYDAFMLECQASEAPQASQVALSFIRNIPDDMIVKMGQLAREYWLKYLDSTYWPRIMAEAVKRQLVMRGLLLCA